jgi:hypothetical protein
VFTTGEYLFATEVSRLKLLQKFNQLLHVSRKGKL